MKHLVLVGATSAIAQHCARLWLEANDWRVTLVGRDTDRLEMVAADLRTRSPGSIVDLIQVDLTSPRGVAAAVARIVAVQAPDLALVAHGLLPDQGLCQKDLEACHEALVVTGVSPVLFAESLAGAMSQAGCGTLGVISSVAGDRGRQSNYIYGAAKGLLDRYVEGMQHRFARTRCHIALIKPGPTETPMTAELRSRGMRTAPVERVAADIVRGLALKRRVIYTPGIWRWIMFVIRHLPYAVFSRTSL